eukprot:Sdes_comp23602_c0_seq1m21803
MKILLHALNSVFTIFWCFIACFVPFATYSYIVLFFFWPLKTLGFLSVYDYIKRVQFDWVFAPCAAIFKYYANIHVLEYTDDFLGEFEPQKSLIIPNHSSYCDCSILNYWIMSRNMTGLVNWVVFKKYLQIPFIFAGWLKGDASIYCKWELDQLEMTNSFQSFLKSSSALCYFIFPEGTVKNPQKMIRSRNFEQKNKKPVLKNLLYPRSKGFLFFVKLLRGSTLPKYLYDVTVMYEGWGKEFPSFLDQFRYSSTPRKIHIHI